MGPQVFWTEFICKWVMENEVQQIIFLQDVFIF